MNLAFAIAALGGCGADLPPIELDELQPNWAYNGEVSEITVTGENFYPSVTASSFAEPEVGSDFRAWVETDPPTELFVRPTSLTALEVQVPEGLEVGQYGFTVESSNGNRDTLDDALSVTDTPADALAATVDDGSVVVSESVTVHLEVLDPDDRPVLPYSIQVDVSVVTGADVQFEAGTLDDQTTLEGGGIRGTISDGGYIRLTTGHAGSVELRIAPSDPTSPVDPATVNLTFASGAPTSLDVVAASSPAGIVAGVPVIVQLSLRDEDGNIATDAHGNVIVAEACGSLEEAQTFSITGSATVKFPLVHATGSVDCAENYLIAQWETLSGNSDALTVLPGDPDQLGVSVVQPVLSAGVREGIVSVTMEDAYGNKLPDYGTVVPDLALEDNVDGLEPGGGTGWQECDPFVNGVAMCTVELWRVGDAVRITARTGAGLFGTSPPFLVIAGAPAYIEVAPPLPVVQAGDDVPVWIHVTDGPGNVIHFDASTLLVITDENEAPLDCQYEGVDPTIAYEVHVFECHFTQVGTHRVSVDMPSAGLYDFESSDIAVQNGELAIVSIDLGATTIGAGMTFYADFVGTDAWGNPYVVKSDPDVEVRDASGTLTPTVVSLDAAGKALNQPMNVKRAALSNRLVAMQDDRWLGSSPVFAITAGSFEEFLVDVDGPVVSIDDPGIVLVSAVDNYGNAIASYDGPVSLSSNSGFGNRVSITSWVDGRAAVKFPFDTLGMQDWLVADDGVNPAGLSTKFDVVDFGCPAGPTAHLDVGSGLPLRLCLLPGMGATAFDLSGSVAGAESIVVYHYLNGDGLAFRTAASGWTTTWTQPGGYAVSGIVIDRDLCASESSGWVYVGYNDGQPVGPVDVEIAGGATSVHADGGFVGVDVRGWTCAGDWAIGGTLLATVDLGDLWVAGANRKTGSGIELALDASGTGNIEWSMENQPAGGIATFVAGVRSGAAHGEVTLDVDGDSSHPTVLEVSPVGTLHDDFDTIAILFSDPIQAASISATSVVLSDPFGTPIALDGLTLASSGPNAGRELVLDFPVQPPDLGAYTLTVMSDLRKAPGPYDNANTLDGDYDAIPPGIGDFVVTLGEVSELAPDLVSCDPSTTLFRPDGDASGDDPFEADVVELDLTATGPAAFWLLEIFDPFGERVFVSHFVANALDTGTLYWDGRNSDGTILDNGTYTVAVTAKDASWNEGAPCLANVTIDNLLAPVSE